MSKKDYQAIARAIYQLPVLDDNDPGDQRLVYKADVICLIADVLQADNPRFDRDRFVEACETGHCRGMRAA